MSARKRIIRSLVAVLFVGLAWTFVAAKPVSAAYNGDNLIDSTAFLNSAAMSANDIQSFLASKGSGLANRSFVLNCYGPSSKERQWYTAAGAPCDQNIPASHIIYYASQIYGINPQVALATMQKEQSLITTANPTDWQINQAMGYGCPTSGGCGASSFFYQIDSGIWVLRYHYERARGNTTWWNNNTNWTCGTAKAYYTPNLYPGQNVNFHDQNGVHYRTHYLHNAATSSLYCYTPHAYNNPSGLHGLPAYGHTGMYYSGSYNFVLWFQRWFDPISTIAGSLTMQNVSQPDLSPARGQTVTYTVRFTNTLADSITLDAVGIVGRAGDIRSSHSRDFGWQGPVTFTSGETKEFTFTTVIYDTTNIYVWPAVNYKGFYLHFNNWGAVLSAHLPKLTQTSPLASSVPNPVASQTTTLSATIRNDEDQPVDVDAIGIPVRYHGSYNYDTAWITLNDPIQPGASQVVSGNVVLDKSGPYTAWLSGLITNQYTTLSSTLNLNVAKATPNFQLTYTETPNTNPALGEDVAVKFKLKNNSGVAMTLDAVGVVGRYDNPFSGANRDFGWAGSQTFSAGEEKTYTAFVSNVSELKNFYAWVAILYQGQYVHYNNWGFMMAPHLPNISITTPLSVNGGSPELGESNAVTVSVKNNEPKPIKYSALGTPIRFHGVYNYDTTWQGSGTLAASGQAGDTVNLSGSKVFDKSGPYTVWASIFIQGRFMTIGNPLNFSL